MQSQADEDRDETRIHWYLRKIPFLSALGPQGLQALIPKVELRELSQRHVVYLPGDPGDRVFFINGGRVKCSKVTRDGKELTLGYRGPGQIFGELAILDGAPRQEMAEVMKSAIVIEMARDDFRDLLRDDAGLAFDFACIIGERRRQAETRLEHLVFRDVAAKLAALLLDLGDEYGQATDDGLLLTLKITHQEMANLIGSTRETISLTLSQFKKKGLVLLTGRAVVLTDVPGLRALV